MSLPKKNYGVIMTKFNGEKPITFAFEENGEQYMIGSQVINRTFYEFITVNFTNQSGWLLPPNVQGSSLQEVSRPDKKKSDQ